MEVVAAERAAGRGRGAPAEPWVADEASMGGGSEGAAELPEVGEAASRRVRDVLTPAEGGGGRAREGPAAVDRAAEERCRERCRSLVARLSGRESAERRRGAATVGAGRRESSSERDGDLGDEGSLSNFTTTVIGGMTMAGGEDWRRLASTRRIVFAEKERHADEQGRGGDGRKVFEEEENGGRRLVRGRT